MILGREAEQAAIKELLGHVQNDSGGAIILLGDPGMGKTTLLDWTANEASDVTVLRATGRESEADLPFAALADLLDPLKGRIALLTRRQSTALRSALALVAPSSDERGAVSSAVVNLLSKSLQERPVIMLIDDYQWLDRSSRSVIDFIVRRAESYGFGMVIATRSLVPPEHSGEELSLAPLSEREARDLVGSLRSTDSGLIPRIVQLAAGNPLALVELPRHLSVRDLTFEATNPPPVSVAIERAFRAQLEPLSEATQEALLVVALEGSGLASRVYDVLAADDSGPSALESALDSKLLVLDGSELRFRHPLLRSVVHQAASPQAVRRIHELIALTAKDPDQEAWHLAAAALGPDLTIANHLEEAGERAMSRGAAASAIEAFRRAATLRPDDEGKRKLTAMAAKAAHRAGDMALTESLIGEAKRLSDSPGPDPSLLILEADIRMRRGDFVGASGALRAEAAAVAETDLQRAVTMLLLASKLRVYRFEGAAALAEVEAALSLLPTAERELVHLASLAMTTTMAGRDDARATVIEAAERARISPHGHTHTLGIGWPLVWLEEYEAAQDFVNRSIAIQREGGHLAYLPQALLARAELDFRTGHWEAAREHADEALRLFHEGNQPTEAACASGLLAKLDAVVGDEATMRQRIADAVESDQVSGLRTATAFARASSGLFHLGRGEFPEAIPHLQGAQELARIGEIGEPWLLTSEADLAEALIRVGDQAEGEAVAKLLVERGQELGRKSAVAAGLRCLALAALPDAFGPLFERAVEIHRDLPTPFETARTELCWGERLRRNRQRVESREHLRQAQAIFERLGANPWIDRTQAELNASGETLQRRSPRAQLTPQERQVASLVAAGHTNREAAAKLFVSAKTIEFHLGAIYRKLGLRSRTELANAWQRSRQT